MCARIALTTDNQPVMNMPCRKTDFKLFAIQASVFLYLTLGLLACQTAPSASKPQTKDNNAVPATAKTKDNRPIIVAFGDSLTAGYGLSEAESYTTLLQQKVDAAGYAYRIVNAGVSGDTSAGGARRLEWSLEGDVRYLILELGGNDGLRGLPTEELKKNLGEIISTAQRRKITVILAGMEAPPNLGAAYANAFRQVYRDLARQYNVPLIPFVLAGVGGKPVRSIDNRLIRVIRSASGDGDKPCSSNLASTNRSIALRTQSAFFTAGSGGRTGAT